MSETFGSDRDKSKNTWTIRPRSGRPDIAITLRSVGRRLLPVMINHGEAGVTVDPSKTTLTPSEILALSLGMIGCGQNEAARALGVSPRTIQNHQNHARRKTASYSLAGAVSMTFANELFVPYRYLEPVRLPPRHIDVLDCMAEDMSYRQGAHWLGISHGTFRKTAETLYDRLDVDGRDVCIFTGHLMRHLPAPERSA